MWRAFELRPAGSPPIPPEYLARIAEARPRFEAMAREQHGLMIRSGPFGINSRRALIGSKAAEAHSAEAGKAYHDAVFRAYWQEAQDISDDTVLEAAAVKAGLDGVAFRAALADPQYDYAVEQDVLQAAQIGLSGVPAMIFAGRYLVSGAQPFDVLMRVVEKVRGED